MKNIGSAKTNCRLFANKTSQNLQDCKLFFTFVRSILPPSAMNGQTSTMNVRTPPMNAHPSAMAEEVDERL